MSSITSNSNYPNFIPKFNSSKNKPNPKPKRKQKRKNRKSCNENKYKNTPNWLELPEEIWYMIFSKLRTMEIMAIVPDVCMLFQKISKQPSLYKVVDMTVPDEAKHLPNAQMGVNLMTKYIVDRSRGGLTDIYLEMFCDDPTLMYIVQRSKNLKHLRLGNYISVSEEGLINAVKALPKLEEIEIIICIFSDKTLEAIGHACPSLKSFSWNNVGSKTFNETDNAEVLAIARSMPNLRRLQLIGNTMDNEGLKAILDGCPYLESLDLRACFQLDLSGDLGKRCAKIKHLRLPNDSTADYKHDACTTPFEEELVRELISSPITSDYDSDDTGLYDINPDILDYLEVDEFGDVYLDPFCEAIDCFPSYSSLDDHSDSDFSD